MSNMEWVVEVDSDENPKYCEISVKNLYIPYSLKWKCKGCKTKQILDFSKTPLTSPKLDEGFTYLMSCTECGRETPIKLKVSFKLEVLE